MELRGAHVSRLSAPIDEFMELVAVERLKKPDAVEVFAQPVDHESVMSLIAELEGVRKRLNAAPSISRTTTPMTAHELPAMMTRLRERQADLEQHIARSGRADIIGRLVTSEDVKATWQAMSTARKRAPSPGRAVETPARFLSDGVENLHIGRPPAVRIHQRAHAVSRSRSGEKV